MNAATGPETNVPHSQAVADAKPEWSPLSTKAVPITIIVPCYNEVESIHLLRETLLHTQRSLGPSYLLHFVFVNDASSDGTSAKLRETFADWEHCQFIDHCRNQGITGAIMTGIAAAPTEIVCSIDCDCSYDPSQLRELLPLMKDGVDLVTASPYHPLGRVQHVPRWRLLLSRGLSAMYRRVLPLKLFTYTSCFRVYRRSSMMMLDVQDTGFLGVAETMAQLAFRGAKVVECPAILQSRVCGHSKMKIVRTMWGHLRLLTQLVRYRIADRKIKQQGHGARVRR
ncbi:MAG: glycosyltransferase family 2 protein [Pirellulaceae bacterium]|nr:glycosyltransferase family 2 protein [Planctomycetales bacterium]